MYTYFNDYIYCGLNQDIVDICIICEVWPSMVTHTQNFYSAFNPSKYTHTVMNTYTHTHTHTHTHTLTHTHGGHKPEAVGSHIAAAPGEQLWVRFLFNGLTSVVVLKVKESAGYSLPPTTISAGLETQTSVGLQMSCMFKIEGRQSIKSIEIY